MLNGQLLLALAATCAAQSTTAELFGVVRDPAGLAAPNATVSLRNAATQAESTAVTGPAGAYHFYALRPGSYTITASKEGFAGLRRDGLVLRVGDRISLDLTLQVGDFTQQVDVTTAAPLLQENRGTVSFLVERRKVVTLPLDGRNFIPLIAQSPGVMLPPGSTLPRINGSRPRVSEYIYDGISVLQPEPGQVAYYPIVDAIEEFRLEVNSYSAEYGRSNGGVILVSQKSGSNELHGTLFEFFRNDALNARNLFATTGPRPRFRRNQYGFVVGGPLRKNRTFFFADWQGARLQTGTVRTSTVPTALQQQGIFTTGILDPLARSRFPNDTVPASRWDPAAHAVIGRYPAPNVASTANNFVRIGTERSATDQFDLRLDQNFHERHRIFIRYAYLRDDAHPITPLPDGSGNIASGVIGATLTRADSAAVEHTWTMSPSQVNQLRFGYTRRGFDRSSLRTGRPASEVSGIPNLPSTAFSDTLPTYDVVGFQQLGPPSNGNAAFTTSVTQFIDTFSWRRGRHSLKAGTDLRLERLDVLQPPSPTGLFQFTSILTSGPGAPGNSFASFLLGQVQNFQIDAQSEVLGPRARIAEFFFQDDLQATRRLALNLGVRHTLNFPSTVKHDRGAVFNLGTQQLDFLGRDGYPRTARHLEKRNFGPRVGLAFKLTATSVVRGGYGITWIEQAGITTPFTTPLFPFLQTLGQRSLDNLTPAFVLSRGPSIALQTPNPDSGLGQGVFAVQRNQKSGYAQQWNLSWQKTFGQNWSVEAGYLGSKLTNLGVPDVNLNQLSVAQLASGTALTENVPNPYFGRIPPSSSLGGPTIARQQLLRPYPRFTTVALYRNNVGHSTYHSFQSRIEKRFSAGLTFSAAYTFSKLIDDAGAVFDAAILTGPAASYQAADSFNRRLEKDVSTGHIPHVLAGSFVWEIPLGLQLAGILRAQSGSPLAVTQATNLNAFAGFGIQRPNRISDPQLPPAQRTTGRWFNTSAFSAAPQFTLGNSSRNPLRGPNYRTLDLMIGKSFPLTERLRADLRAEAFNVTNTPPLGNPNGSFGTTAFGTITTAQDPRVFELVLKVHF